MKINKLPIEYLINKSMIVDEQEFEDDDGELDANRQPFDNLSSLLVSSMIPLDTCPLFSMSSSRGYNRFPTESLLNELKEEYEEDEGDDQLTTDGKNKSILFLTSFLFLIFARKGLEDIFFPLAKRESSESNE